MKNIRLPVSTGKTAYHPILPDGLYNPFVELAQWATRIAEGYQACLEVDEEGCFTQCWLSREPGSAIGRLQVFEPGPSGRPEPPRIDAVVDCVQLAHAYHGAFSAYVGIHDPRHWDWDDDGVARSSPRNRLAGVELRGLAAALQSYGVIPTDEPFAELREAYEAELGDRAMSVILSDTPPAKRSTCQ